MYNLTLIDQNRINKLQNN